jgi:hypothetical protein
MVRSSPVVERRPRLAAEELSELERSDLSAAEPLLAA